LPTSQELTSEKQAREHGGDRSRDGRENVEPGQQHSAALIEQRRFQRERRESGKASQNPSGQEETPALAGIEPQGEIACQ
jgi:hypothetical protein